MTHPVAPRSDNQPVATWRGRRTGRCVANDKVITVWDDRYCTDAAGTNSTTKQRAVIALAMFADAVARIWSGHIAACRIALFDIAGACWVQAPREHRIEYHVASDRAEYRAALDRLPAFLNQVRPRLVQYQAGMDPFEGDPVGGVDGVNEAFLGERDRFVIDQVRSRAIPLVVNLAGGYVPGVSERLHFNTVRAMSAALQKYRAA